MKKLRIIWNNGDKETLEITDEYYENFLTERPWERGFTGWSISFSSGRGGINLTYARKVYVED